MYRLASLAQTCINSNILAQTCTNLHKLAQICTNLHNDRSHDYYRPIRIRTSRRSVAIPNDQILIPNHPGNPGSNSGNSGNTNHQSAAQVLNNNEQAQAVMNLIEESASADRGIVGFTLFWGGQGPRRILGK